MDKIKVLYIDDEVENLNAFKAAFRRQFDVHLGNSADEGMEILKKEPIEVVISDQRMPNKTGVDFFEAIVNVYPNPIRILLTGYSDINAVIDAVNKGHIYRYVTKPWSEYDLKLTIENAYHLYHLKEQNNKLNMKYRKVFSDSSDPILLFDLKGRIIDYNKTASNFFNTNSKNLNMVTFSSLIKEKRGVETLLEILNTKGLINGFECQVYGKDNEIKTCLISANKITNNYGEIISYQAILKDITEHSKLNQLLLKKVIETQEKERERIARDLHDGIGQSLAAIKLHIESLKASVHENNDITNELETIPKLLQDAIQDLRQICFNTLPIVLKEHGLIKAIEELKSNISNLDFNVKFYHEENFPIINKSLEISIFRIVQEFINNSIKHSHATEVKIDLKVDDEHIIINLTDNGIGFNINDLEIFSGHGLKNIKTRIESFNGDVNINSIIDKGTEFDITIPIILN